MNHQAGNILSSIHQKALTATVRAHLDAEQWVSSAKRSDVEEGSTTVEYAIGAIATAGFAGLLIAILKSGGVKAMITSIIQSALSI